MGSASSAPSPMPAGWPPGTISIPAWKRPPHRCSSWRTCTPIRPCAAAAEACEQRWQDFYSTLGQNPRLARALRAVPAADAIDQRLRQDQIEGFDDAGVGLPPAPRAQAKRLQDRLARLAQRFDRRLRDARIQVPFTEAELAGVPPDLFGRPRRATARAGVCWA